MIRTYLELLVSLPWMKSTGEKIDLPHARLVLNRDHYDLEKVKERILEYLAVRHLKEKVLAAYRSGISTVILPMKNEQELMEDLPRELREQTHFVCATDIKQVLDAALEPVQEQETTSQALLLAAFLQGNHG
jgi:ATP-dependent Lon protease